MCKSKIFNFLLLFCLVHGSSAMAQSEQEDLGSQNVREDVQSDAKVVKTRVKIQFWAKGCSPGALPDPESDIIEEIIELPFPSEEVPNSATTIKLESENFLTEVVAISRYQQAPKNSYVAVQHTLYYNDSGSARVKGLQPVASCSQYYGAAEYVYPVGACSGFLGVADFACKQVGVTFYRY